jgi:glycolate oxidase FAD binding subunit
MQTIAPASAEEMAACLAEAAAAGKRILIEGNESKKRAGGAIAPADLRVSTLALDKIHEYEPRDLTISAGAGVAWARLTEMLDRDGYMAPLDPCFASQATVGGVVAANSSGPRRRLYGSARDLVIGMTFCTLEGKIVQSGGMVVKNVAGLDMAKLMIGSLGTLAAIATVNFKLIPKPAGTLTFLFDYPNLAGAIAERDRLIRGVLQPAAVDLLNPVAAAALGRSGWLLAIAVSGNRATLNRYRKELSGAQILDGWAEREFWESVTEFPARFLVDNPAGAIIRVTVTLSSLEDCLKRLPGAVVARAANGICYCLLADAAQGAAIYPLGKSLMEYGPEARDETLLQWPQIDSGFPMMQRIKNMFDPNHLLNRGRFYGRF